MRNSVQDILNLKRQNKKIVCLTAYTYPTAQILDSHCDIILVGDSLGMVIYGLDSTLPVTLDMMINHGSAVVKASEKALVVIDMPFGSYQESPQKAFKNAAKIMKRTGAMAVKIEGGAEMAETISYITQRGIPVMGHIGLKPQYFNSVGGYKVQGKTEGSKQLIFNDLEAIENSGAFSIVLESVSEKTANEVCEKSSLPIIGIGASKNCDGQVLVTEDLLGVTSSPAKFVKKYANLSQNIESAVSDFSEDVRQGKFPTSENLYS